MLLNLNSVSSQNDIRSYQLKDGETVTFTNGDIFYITGLTNEENKNKVSTITSTATKYSTTPILTAHHDCYSMTGNIRIYSVYTKGYFQYNKQTVKAYYIDSWYTRGFCSVWQVSNWKEGGLIMVLLQIFTVEESFTSHLILE
jgi:hypothetical protein